MGGFAINTPEFSPKLYHLDGLEVPKNSYFQGFLVPRETRPWEGWSMFHVEHFGRLEAHRHNEVERIVVIGLVEHASCVRVLKLRFHLFAC